MLRPQFKMLATPKQGYFASPGHNDANVFKIALSKHATKMAINGLMTIANVSQRYFLAAQIDIGVVI